MSFTHQVTEKVVIDGATISKLNTLTGGQKVSISEDIPVGNDQLVALNIDVSQVKSCFIVSDRALLLETNSSSSPAQTLTLVAGIPYVWYTSKYDSLKFSTDITALYVTNSSGGTAALQIEFLVDPTV